MVLVDDVGEGECVVEFIEECGCWGEITRGLKGGVGHGGDFLDLDELVKEFAELEMPFLEEVEVVRVAEGGLELIVVHEGFDLDGDSALLAPDMLEAGEELLGFLVDELFDEVGSFLFPVIGDKLKRNYKFHVTL